MDVGSAASNYEILAKLAEGGMAEIFLARSISSAGVERMVVLKRVLPDVARDPLFVELFVAEARLAAQLQHANIVQVYDVGKLGSSYFFAMEYVHGETVRDMLLRARKNRTPLPIGTVLTVIAGAAAGLSHAHDRRGLNGRPLNIVHRDISPSNLMVSRDGVVKVVDFGIAKAEQATTDIEHPVQGKLCYMSPEQIQAATFPVDRRSDLFSLGIVMWELLTLQGLFRGASDFMVMNAIVEDSILRPSDLRLDVPPEVDAITMRLLDKSPTRRYQTAGDLLEAIETAAMKLGLPLSSAALARQLRELFGEKPEPWLEQTQGGTRRIVVHTEDVPANFAPTIAGTFTSDDAAQTIAGPIDMALETLEPALSTRPTNAGVSTTTGGMPAWETETYEQIEAMRDRLFREVREKKARGERLTPVPGRPTPSSERPTPAPERLTPAPERSTPIPGPAAVAPSIPSPIPGTLRDSKPHVAPVMGWRREKPTSPVPVIVLGLLITVVTGGVGFALLSWKLGTAPSPTRDAGTSHVTPPAPADAPVAVPPPARALVAPTPADAGAETKAEAEHSIQKLYARADHAGVIAACLARPIARNDATLCALSACSTRDAVHAHQWIRRAPEYDAERVAAKCRANGIPVRIPTKADACATDPDACVR